MIPHWALNVTSSQALVWQVPRGTVLTAGIYGSALSSKLRLILHAKSFGLTCTMWYYNDCMNAWWFEFYSVIKWMDVIFLIWLQLIYTKDSPEVLQVRQWRQNKTSYNNNIFLLVCFLDEPYNLKHQDCFLFYITLQTCLLWTFVCTFLCHIQELWLHTDSGQWGWDSDCQLLRLWYSWPTDVVRQHPVH